MDNSPEITNGNFFPDFKPKVDETKAKESVGGKCPTINHEPCNEISRCVKS